VLLFCVGIMIITVPAVALLPALRASRVRLAESLGDRSGVAQSRGDLLLRDGLVVAQLAVTVVMLAAGGALGRSLATLHQTDPGFPSSGLVAAAITLPPAAFADASGSRGFFEEVAREVRALPDVEAAAMTSLLPFSGHYFTTGVRVEGRAYATDDYGEMVDRVIATPEYLSTLGIPVVQGRWLREGDRFDAPDVAIINTHLARRLFGTEDPLGRRIRLSFADSAQTVVGVVGPVLMAALDEPPRGQVYLPLAQAGALEMTLVARASGDPLALVPSIRRAVARVRAEQPVGDVATVDSLVAEARRPVRFMSLLLAALASVALVIATAGLYGVSAYFTRSRRHEFAIRRVLGAQATDVVGLVLRRALRLIALGLLLGVLAALGSGRILSRLLVDVEPGDP
jgi:predicted permease